MKVVYCVLCSCKFQNFDNTSQTHADRIEELSEHTMYIIHTMYTCNFTGGGDDRVLLCYIVIL